MFKHAFLLFPVSGAVILAALLYPREAAATNILLSAPLWLFYAWFAVGLIEALVRSRPASARLLFGLLAAAPVLVLLLRTPAPL